MSRIAISIQTLDGRKDMYLRKEIGTLHKQSVLDAVTDMLTHPDAHNLSKVKAKSPWAKRRQSALKGDEEPATERGSSGHSRSSDLRTRQHDREEDPQ